VGDGQALERVRTELHAEPRAHQPVLGALSCERGL
jgi:hypothetical protein